MTSNTTTASDLAHDDCPHEKSVKHFNENDDRIRATHYCTLCKTYWIGCYAKRTDSEGREAWGTVGAWYWSAWHLPDGWVR